MDRKNSDYLLDLFKKKCKENNLKITPQRIAVYKELLKSKDHPNADGIFKRVRKILPHISFDTVNRTLLSFSEIGILHIVEGYGEPKRFDPDVKSHHHFRCVKCNRIIDFYNRSYNNLKIPKDIKNQHIIISKKVVLDGICDKCKKSC